MSAQAVQAKQIRRICDDPNPLSGIGLCFACMHMQIGASGNEIEEQTQKPSFFDRGMTISIITVLVTITVVLAVISSH